MKREEEARLIAIPIVGLAIGNVSGLLDGLAPSSAVYWAGSGYFMLTSLVVWQFNRLVYLRLLQDRWDWITDPKRRLRALLINVAVCTIPSMVAMLWIWYRLRGIGTDWTAIRNATIVALVFSAFITATYETLRLIRQRARAELETEKLERAKVQAELAALKSQIDPHFMFNSLNTLASLIEEDPARALDFNYKLAEIYRYILAKRNVELVPLREEVAFLNNYYSLLKLRFEDGIDLRLPREKNWPDGLLIPPISLQVLLENAVKHNECAADAPLTVRLEMFGDTVKLENEKRPRRQPRVSTRVGLKNLDERCRLILGRGIEVEDGARGFGVALPVKRAGTEPFQVESPASVPRRP